MNNMKHIISKLDADVVLNNIDNMVLGYEGTIFHLPSRICYFRDSKNL